MAFLLSLLIAILPALSAATRLGGRHYGLSPRQTVTCNFAITASNGDTCDSIAASWGLTLDDFKTLNPGVNCPTLVVGQRYCVLGSVSTAPPTTSTATSTAISSRSTTSPPTATSTTTRAPTTTTTSSNVHEPTQPGLAPNCLSSTTHSPGGLGLISTNITAAGNNFYFVKTGDTCDRIIARYGISFAQLFVRPQMLPVASLDLPLTAACCLQLLLEPSSG